MGRLYIFGAIAGLLVTMVSISWATSNLNLSKSNINRLISPKDTVSSAQAAAILADVDAATQQSQGRIILEGAVKQALTKQGLQTKIKKIIIKPASAAGQLTTIIILSDLAQEAEALAIAVSDPGMPAEKPTKGTKTN